MFSEYCNSVPRPNTFFRYLLFMHWFLYLYFSRFIALSFNIHWSWITRTHDMKQGLGYRTNFLKDRRLEEGSSAGKGTREWKFLPYHVRFFLDTYSTHRCCYKLCFLIFKQKCVYKRLKNVIWTIITTVARRYSRLIGRILTVIERKCNCNQNSG